MTLTSRVQVLVTGCKAQGLRSLPSCGRRPSCGPLRAEGPHGANRPTVLLLRPASTTTNKANSAVVDAKDSEGGHLTIGQKVKQTTKDASYLGVILAGLGVTGLMFYAIFRELFSGHSPNSVYSRALERCRADPRVTAAVGEPVQGHGETTTRGRRRHVPSLPAVSFAVSLPFIVVVYVAIPSFIGMFELIRTFAFSLLRRVSN